MSTINDDRKNNMINKQLKIIIGIFVGFLFFGFGWCMLGGEDEYPVKYPTGRDTRADFAGGRYQILKGIHLSLKEYGVPSKLEEEIYKYQEKNKKLYVYGRMGYMVIDLKTNEIKQQGISSEFSEWASHMKRKYGDRYTIISKYEDFTEEERQVFDSMK